MSEEKRECEGHGVLLANAEFESGSADAAQSVHRSNRDCPPSSHSAGKNATNMIFTRLIEGSTARLSVCSVKICRGIVCFSISIKNSHFKSVIEGDGWRL